MGVNEEAQRKKGDRGGNSPGKQWHLMACLTK